MSLFTPENKRKIRKLTDPRLRKIRYEIRTLFYLFYQNKLLDLLGEQKTSEIERIKLIYNRNPISCWFCGNRKEDLTQDLGSLFWFCCNHTMP